MRFGICCSKEEAPAMLEAGFDYVELAAARFADDPRVYAGIPLEATNVFFPGTVRLFGPSATPYLDVAKRIVEAGATLGTKIMVIGSGTARTAPPGADPDEAERKFIDIATEIAAFATTHGVTIAPESLSRNETNVGNDLPRLAQALKERGVAYTADSYHVLQEWHDDNPEQTFLPASFWTNQLPFAPAHVHFATLKGRSLPEPNDLLLTGFFARLVELGYDARMSFEGARGDATPSEALGLIKALWSSATEAA